MADVKFSELTALAAATVDAADVLAIVDTSASTSKKLSIDNLFGAVPVNIAVADATDSGSISTGSIQTAGGIGVTKALSVGTTSTFTGNILPAASGTVDIGSASAEINDMFFSTGSVLNFGNDQEVTVTAAAAGLTVNSSKKLMFGDAASFIHQSADGVLTIDGEATIDLNGSTAVLVSNDLKLDSDAAVLGFGVNNDVTLTHVADTALMLNAAMQLRFRDAAINIGSSTDGQMEIAADTEVQIDTTTVDLNGILDVSGASTLTGVVTVAAGIIADAQDGAYLGSSTRQFSDLFLADEAVIAFGDDGDVTLTHVLDTGLLLSDDSGVGTTQLQFGDAGTYVHQSADGALDLVSDGSINATVGAAGMVLKGTTPKLTIGDAGAEDTFIVFDGNAQDYRIGLDDGTDILEMGVGAAHGTTPSVKLSSDLSVDIAGHNGTVGLKLGGTVVGSTAAELNLLDGSAKSTASITIADADAFIVIDGSTTKQIPASDLETYLESSLDTLTSVTAVGTLTGLTVSGAIIPNASGTVSLGSASAEWNDMFFSTASVLNFGDAQDMTLTHDATNGLTVNSTKKFMFGAATEFVHGSGSTTLALGAATAITATTPTVTFAAAGADQVIKHGTDVYDLAFQQTDGNEVARIHDGATAATLETTALDLTAGAAGKGGFGFKRPVYNVTAGSDDADCLLAMKHSGAMIMVTGSAYDMDIILPVIAAGDEGWHVTVAVTTAFSGTNNLEIATNGHGDATDRIYLYMNTAGTSGAEATSSDDVVKFVDDVAAGTLCRMTCVKGGTNEVWIAEVLQPAGTAATTTAAVA